MLLIDPEPDPSCSLHDLRSRSETPNSFETEIAGETQRESLLTRSGGGDDAGSVVLVDKTNPIIGTDELVSNLMSPEYVTLRQVSGQVFGYVDLDPTSNQQFYDYATFTTTTTTPGADPSSVWANLAPESWQLASPCVPESFAALGMESRSPVAAVSFEAADLYCTYALKRLPTEIEWELAARDGLIDASAVQNWVDGPGNYGEVPEGSRVLRGSFGIEELPLYFRTIGDSPTN